MEFNIRQFTWKRDSGIWSGVVEASSLGLKPGEWPSFLIVTGYSEQRIFHDETLPHPDSFREANEVGHRYGDGRGCFIRILND